MIKWTLRACTPVQCSLRESIPSVAKDNQQTWPLNHHPRKLYDFSDLLIWSTLFLEVKIHSHFHSVVKNSKTTSISSNLHRAIFLGHALFEILMELSLKIVGGGVGKQKRAKASAASGSEQGLRKNNGHNMALQK